MSLLNEFLESIKHISDEEEIVEEKSKYVHTSIWKEIRKLPLPECDISPFTLNVVLEAIKSYEEGKK